MKDIATVYRISLVKEGEVSYSSISDPDGVYSILLDLGLDTAAEEYFYVLCTNAKGNIASIFEVSHGELSASLVHPREVLKRIMLCNAFSFLIAHNHPSGDPTPSSEDSAVTDRLADAGRLLGIPLIDSLVIGADAYFSFKKEGLL